MRGIQPVSHFEPGTFCFGIGILTFGILKSFPLSHWSSTRWENVAQQAVSIRAGVHHGLRFTRSTLFPRGERRGGEPMRRLRSVCEVGSGRGGSLMRKATCEVKSHCVQYCSKVPTEVCTKTKRAGRCFLLREDRVQLR